MKTVKLGIRTVTSYLEENANVKREHTFKVEIIEEFGDKVRIEYRQHIDGPMDGSASARFSKVVPITSIEGIHTKQISNLKYFFGRY